MQAANMVGKAMSQNWSFYEFFAGGGMARAGLGEKWRCTFANDFDPMKARTYRSNWGDEHLFEGDVAKVTAGALPEKPDLVWASFPCQDLSLAGKYQGLGDRADEKLTRSGTFWPFWSLMQDLHADARHPRLIVLENVPGTITSRGGKDFGAICGALAGGGYRFGAMIIDARHFVPQSRPRLFVVAVSEQEAASQNLMRVMPSETWHPESLRNAVESLPASVRDKWLWWTMPLPARRNSALGDLIEDDPTGCKWHTETETGKLIEMMAPLHREKIDRAIRSGQRQVGSVYKRTRPDERGIKRQRAEVRFDDVAGCLRTPGGGSSRQTIVVVEGQRVRTRLLAPREAARLMGLNEEYRLPERYNDAYKVAGDGVCVPVVRFLAENLLEPILSSVACTNHSLAA